MKLTKDQESLMDAVYDGNTKRVKALLKKGADPDFDDAYGSTPLHAAIRNGSLPIVKALSDAGADFNRTDYLGNNALETADYYNQAKIAKYLEDEGATRNVGLDDDDDWMHSGRKAKTAKSRTRPRASRGGGNFWDDDDYFFDDDEDVKPKKKAAPKKAAAKKSTAAPTIGGLSDGGAAPELTPPKITFREDNLQDIFNPKSWAGKTEEMEKLWDDVPTRLKKKFDFAAALAEARRDTLKQNAPPQRLTLKPSVPKMPPPAAPNAPPPKGPDYEI
jgi:hypothetical protein